ncbi:MAG: hypothetical protein DI556_13125 [Rhodovulum sulfidophilum]|uniref:EF-hand domain-containing protein n=1 Tax=Rhodovulum sulfidophilum TaxID=35806 RepID=A0A2W5N6N4_RHOSU|nr:MAG: hypothetical protein DI556_13125 [Rhodovulum sulfidophilum]
MKKARRASAPAAGAAIEAAPARAKRSTGQLVLIGALVLGFAGAFGYVALKPKLSARGAQPASGLGLAPDWIPRILPAAGSLVLVDLSARGAAIRPLEASGAHFDFAGDGFAERTAWPMSGTGILGYLVPIEGGGQRFELISGTGGEGPLAAFDENGDGRLDAADFWFGRIAVWNDVDGDGFVGEREIRSLASYFVGSIALDPVVSGDIPAGGRRLGEIRYADGTAVEAREILTETAPSDTVMLVPTGFQWDQRVYLLPNLGERGIIPSAAYAMSADPALLEAGERLTRRLLNGQVAIFREELRDFVTALAMPGRGVPGFEDPRLEVLAREAGFTKAMFDATGKPAPSEAEVAGNFDRLVNETALDFCLQAVGLHVPSMEDRMFAAHPLAWLDTMRVGGGFEPDLRVVVERGAEEVARGAMTGEDLIALIEITAPRLDPEAIRALRDRRVKARIDAALGTEAREFHRRLKDLNGDA